MKSMYENLKRKIEEMVREAMMDFAEIAIEILTEENKKAQKEIEAKLEREIKEALRRQAQEIVRMLERK